jgi:hypothetical protein
VDHVPDPLVSSSYVLQIFYFQIFSTSELIVAFNLLLENLVEIQGVVISVIF